MAPNTYGNVSVREGYLKGQSTMGKKWIVNSTVTIEQGKMLYSTPTVKIIFDNGSGIKKELGNIVYWRDNECIRSKKKINPLVARFGIKTKPNRIDLLSRLGNVIISLSAADENTYSYIKNTLRSLIGAAKCEIAETRAERQRKQHLASLTRGGKRRKRRRKTRKHKKRKTKRRKRGGKKAELNACIKKCNAAEEERKKQKLMERKAREKEWMKKTYAMGFPGAIAAHEKRQQDRFAPETWKTRQAELMRGLSGGKRRKTKRKKRRR